MLGSFESVARSFETIGAMTSSFIQGAANLDGNPEPLSESESFFKVQQASKTNLNSSWLDVVCLVWVVLRPRRLVVLLSCCTDCQKDM